MSFFSSWFSDSWTGMLNMAVVGAIGYGVVRILWPKKDNSEMLKMQQRIWEECSKLPQRDFTLAVRLCSQ
jgi:hypothetical protein